MKRFLLISLLIIGGFVAVLLCWDAIRQARYATEQSDWGQR